MVRSEGAHFEHLSDNTFDLLVVTDKIQTAVNTGRASSYAVGAGIRPAVTTRLVLLPGTRQDILLLLIRITRPGGPVMVCHVGISLSLDWQCVRLQPSEEVVGLSLQNRNPLSLCHASLPW